MPIQKKETSIYTSVATRLPRLFFYVILFLPFLFLTACSSGPNEKTVKDHVFQAYDTTHKEEWVLVKITSVEIGKKRINDGAIKGEPNNTFIFPVTVLLNKCSRTWKTDEISISNVREEFLFLKTDKGWNSYKYRSNVIGGGRASDEQYIHTPDASGFQKKHVQQIKEIAGLEREGRAIFDYRSKLIQYMQELTEEKGMEEPTKIKMLAETLSAFITKINSKVDPYIQAADNVGHKLSDPVTAEEKRWSAEYDELATFINNPGFQSTLELWKKLKENR